MDNDAIALLRKAGLLETFWGQRIVNAVRNRHFTRSDMEKAASWTTCACGRLDKGLPRGPYGEPKDKELRVYGYDFNIFVARHRVVGAADTLVRIQKRAIQLLGEQNVTV